MLRPTRRQLRTPAMIDLYARGKPELVKIDIVLDEIGRPYRVHASMSLANRVEAGALAAEARAARPTSAEINCAP